MCVESCELWLSQSQKRQLHMFMGIHAYHHQHFLDQSKLGHFALISYKSGNFYSHLIFFSFQFYFFDMLIGDPWLKLTITDYYRHFWNDSNTSYKKEGWRKGGDYCLVECWLVPGPVLGVYVCSSCNCPATLKGASHLFIAFVSQWSKSKWRIWDLNL